MPADTSVLFVCMGNICRSPTAHGVMRQLLQEQGTDISVQLDSAGTHAWHVNEPLDPRSMEAALSRGVDISDLRARAVELSDFKKFDLILAMDQDNLEMLKRIQPKGSKAQLELMLRFASYADTEEVPDPYHGGSDGFERVLDLLEDASRGLLADLRQR
jgi:protein-tyrosine phosphatase